MTVCWRPRCSCSPSSWLLLLLLLAPPPPGSYLMLYPAPPPPRSYSTPWLLLFLAPPHGSSCCSCCCYSSQFRLQGAKVQSVSVDPRLREQAIPSRAMHPLSFSHLAPPPPTGRAMAPSRGAVPGRARGRGASPLGTAALWAVVAACHGAWAAASALASPAAAAECRSAGASGADGPSGPPGCRPATREAGGGRAAPQVI